MQCRIFWKEVWLERDAKQSDTIPPEPNPADLGRLRTLRQQNVYMCQATELIRASTGDLPLWEPLQYLRDIRSGTFTTVGFLRQFFSLLTEKARIWRRGYGNGAVHQGSDEVLNLQTGEIVEVKSREEILASLDRNGSYRGLLFTTDMYACCGRRYRVRERIERIISEEKGEMRLLSNTVILEDGICDRHRGCGRGMYFLWREKWLKRV
jgi:hypothetical protein